MFIIRKKMDQKLIRQQWTNFLSQQLNQMNSQISSEDDLSNNPYYTKYADKLEKAKSKLKNLKQKQISQNFNEEEKRIKEKFDELEQNLKKKDTINVESLCTRSIQPAKVKKLSDVIKLDLIKDLSKEEIQKIWYEYFKMKDGKIFAYLDSKNYELISESANKYPVFIFILPVTNTDNKQKKNNYQFVLVQFQLNQSHQSLKVNLTPLSFFHAHKEKSPVSLTLDYYTDFKQEKDLVLMEGEYDKMVFNLLEAQSLANQIQIFYADKTKRPLLDKFTNNSNSFNYMELIEEFEKCLRV